MSDDFYVYTQAYPDGTVFYIGKGSGNRIVQHEYEARGGCDCKKCQIIRQIWSEGKDVLKRKLYEHLSEQDALAIEAILIGTFDRAKLANEKPGYKKMLPKVSRTKQKQKPHIPTLPRRFATYEYQDIHTRLYGARCEEIFEEVPV